MSAPLLEARQVRKHFPGVQALDGVSLAVYAGEVLAVVGENGAGKSTLMKVLAGVHAPDGGELLVDGRPVRLGGVSDAARLGIVLIHQELNLAENLSVAANLYLGFEITRSGWPGRLDRGAMDEGARHILARVGLSAAPGRRVGELPLGQRQLVEIARALSRRARVIIMDEPTSSLTEREAVRLSEVIADLKGQGVAVVYISHRLGEVRRVADRVAVLRDGRNSGDLPRDQISHDRLVRLMVGRDLKQFFRRAHPADHGARARLEVRGLRYAGGPNEPISFELRAGEVTGMAGLVGAGRTELSEALFGLRAVTGGGLFLVPEDRRLHGLVLEESVQRNLGLPNLNGLSRLGLLLPGRETALARDLCGRLRVKAARLSTAAGLLSGGNQQKVVLGKWLARQPRVLILDEPTRGVDVGAKGEIYALMDELAGAGIAILMISSDLEEILGMSDRVLVLHEGRLAGDLPRAALSEEVVMQLATGGSLADAGGRA